ncbi:MAG TPA: NAD-dependent epimerase/dehydratase family protein, partial [Acidimicrobiia bacterium]|nr:NAD-dependent epimerase/dehydratase family protein [Acidimicrobiia bacterium]
MARVLVTGGAGFVGSHLCRAFVARGDDVVALDNFVTGSADNVADLVAGARDQGRLPLVLGGDHS